MSFVKSSPVQERILVWGLEPRRATPTAFIKWLLPTPTPPQIKRGLYALPGFLETASVAAQAIWFEEETAKFSKVNPGRTLVLVNAATRFSCFSASVSKRGERSAPEDSDWGFCFTK